MEDSSVLTQLYKFLWHNLFSNQYLPKGVENIYLCKNLHMEASEISFSRWINKQTGTFRPCNIIKETLLNHDKTEESSIHATKWNKSIWKVYTLYDFNYTTLCKRQNYGDNKIWLLEVERWIDETQRIFRAVDIFYTIL